MAAIGGLGVLVAKHLFLAVLRFFLHKFSHRSNYLLLGGIGEMKVGQM